MCKGSCRRRACETVTEGLLPYFINYGGSAAYNPPLSPLYTRGAPIFYCDAMASAKPPLLLTHLKTQNINRAVAFEGEIEGEFFVRGLEGRGEGLPSDGRENVDFS